MIPAEGDQAAAVVAVAWVEISTTFQPANHKQKPL
jgi:hypothetical protein